MVVFSLLTNLIKTLTDAVLHCHVFAFSLLLVDSFSCCLRCGASSCPDIGERAPACCTRSRTITSCIFSTTLTGGPCRICTRFIVFHYMYVSYSQQHWLLLCLSNIGLWALLHLHRVSLLSLSRSLALSPSRPLSRDWQMTGPCLHVSLPRSLLGLVLSLSLSLSLSLWTVFPNKALSLSLRVFLSLVRA